MNVVDLRSRLAAAQPPDQPVYIHDIPQRDPEWFLLRAGVLTASTFKVAASAQGSKTRMDLIKQIATERLTGRPVQEDYSNHWMRRGIELEPEAVQWYELFTGDDVTPCTFVFLNKERRIGASPDGLVGTDGIIEVKCPSLSAHVDYALINAESKTVPAMYRYQTQGLLWVTGRKWLDFVSYHPDAMPDIVVIRTYPDYDFQIQMKLMLEEFLEEVDRMEFELKMSVGRSS